MEARHDGVAVPRIIPPVWALLWLGTQSALTARAGGRRRFRGQTALATAIGAVSLTTGIAALRRFARAGTSSEPHRPLAATALVTDGIYAYTRNPMYCSILLGLLAHAVWDGRLRTLIALPGGLISLRPQVASEEVALGRLFGAAYEDYRTRVPRWL